MKDDDIEKNVATKASSGSSVQEWIYDVMSEWYLWNDDVKEKTPNYVLNYERFFYSLLSHDRGDGKHNSSNSYYYSYIERTPVGTRNSLQAPAELGFGFEFGMVVRQLDEFKGNVPVQKVYAVVTYVYEGSPAWQAGLRRGHHIGKVNGTQMTVSNFENIYPLLLPESSTGKAPSAVSIEWYDAAESGEVYVYEGQEFVLASLGNSNMAHLSPAKIETNPIFTYDVVTADNGRKVGYLVYNSFERGANNAYDDALKNVFHQFKNQGVQELVLDLRYNGGGYVTSAQLLASMIAPESKAGSRYNRIAFNEQVVNKYGTEYDVWQNFLSVGEMSGDMYGSVSGVNLNLSKVYIIGSDNTASSSECLINGLRGADVQVHLIGTPTEGKNVGMHMIGPENGHGGIFDGYEYYLWPVSFYCYNAKDNADFQNGFRPDFYCDEYSEMTWKELGDREELLLATALHHIENGSFPVATRSDAKLGAYKGSSKVTDNSSTKLRKGRGMLIESPLAV